MHSFFSTLLDNLCSGRLTAVCASCDQVIEMQLGAGEISFSLSNLEMGKRYIVTIIAYRGDKRSKVVQTVFTTGRHCSVC